MSRRVSLSGSGDRAGGPGPFPSFFEANVKLVPTNKNIAIYRMDADEMTAGGIFIPAETQKKERPQRGTVAEICEPFRDANGQTWKSQFVVGDLVVFPKYSGEEFVFPGGVKLVLMKESEVLAVAREVSPSEQAIPAVAPFPMASEPATAAASVNGNGAGAGAGPTFVTSNGAMVTYGGMSSDSSCSDEGPLVVRPKKMGRRQRASIWNWARLRGDS